MIAVLKWYDVATTPVQSIVMDLVMVRFPLAKDPAGVSMQTIAPPADVFANAPERVRHGAKIWQPLASSPFMPETYDCARVAPVDIAQNKPIIPTAIASKVMRRITLPPVVPTSVGVENRGRRLQAADGPAAPSYKSGVQHSSGNPFPTN